MYGENSGLLRDALGELLRQHRIQQRIGGAGHPHRPETTTVEERKGSASRSRRYRHAVLVWCHQAMRAANPRIDLEGTTGRTRGPAEELRYRLERSRQRGIASDLPTLDELVTAQQFATGRVLASGRPGGRARRARLRRRSRLRTTLRGPVPDRHQRRRRRSHARLVGLDRRYANIPGWQPLKEPGRLGRARPVCAACAGYGEPDYTVDRRGWQPAPTPHRRSGPARASPGSCRPSTTCSSTSATSPTAQNLRLVLDSQRHRLPRSRPTARTERPGPVWLDGSGAARPTADSSAKTRDLGGMVGKRRIRRRTRIGRGCTHDEARRRRSLRPHQLRRLERISAGIDERVCNAVEYGVSTASTSTASPAPPDNDNGELVQGTTARSSSPSPRPCRPNCWPSCAANCGPHLSSESRRKVPRRSRLDFEAALHHRPPPRGATPDVPSI